MADREKVIKGLEMCLADEYCNGCPYEEECFDPDIDNPWGSGVMRDAIELLKEQEALLREYEKLSQVCFKIEKYLRIADLSILIDRIEEGKVEVLQDDGRLHNSPVMETTIKIRRL